MRNPSALIRLKDADENGAFGPAEYVDVYDTFGPAEYVDVYDTFGPAEYVDVYDTFGPAEYVDVYDKTDIVMYTAGVDHFFIALLSALRQTHCALVTSDSD